jgi:hypothetical protein
LTPTRRGYEIATTALDQNLSSQAIAAGYHVFNVYDIIDTVPNNGKYDAYDSTNYVDSVHPNQAGNKLIGDEFAKYILSLSSQEQVQSPHNFIDNIFSIIHSTFGKFFNISKN